MTTEKYSERICDQCGKRAKVGKAIFGNSPFVGWVSTETLKTDGTRPAGYFERLDFCCRHHCVEYMTAEIEKHPE